MKMRAPVEVMAENRLELDGRTSPQRSPHQPSPLHSPSSREREGMGRTQLSIQELQDLAERQRRQILYSSRELMDKQQQLMRMHNDFRARLRIQNGIDITPNQRTALEIRQTIENRPTIESRAALENRPSIDRPSMDRPPVNGSANTPPSPRISPHPSPPRPSKAPSKRDQDQYARMLRETYHNMGKLQNRGQLQKEMDIKKLNNVELAHELKKVRAIFSSKQNELAEAVKKVDVLTHELEKRKNGDSGASSVPTPERINRRKKIQAAKDELDRLRNELIVRNEMNTQQSQQLQLQRDIIHEKQQELRELNSRINELGSALLKQHAAASGRNPPNYPAVNGYQQRLFNGSYLYDTLNRRRISPGAAGKPTVQDINYNAPSDYTNNAEENSGNEPIRNNINLHPATINNSKNTNNNNNDNKTVNNNIKQTTFVDTPLSGNQIWNANVQNQNLQIQADLPNKSSPPLNSPTSSVSSLSSASSTTTADDYNKIIATINNKGPPPPPPRSVNYNNSSVNPQRTDDIQPYDNEMLTILQPPVPEKNKIELVDVKPYSDLSLSGDSDKLKYEQSGDVTGTSSHEVLESDIKKRKVPPPPLKPKPAVPHTSQPQQQFDSDIIQTQPQKKYNEPENELENPILSSIEDDRSSTDKERCLDAVEMDEQAQHTQHTQHAGHTQYTNADNEQSPQNNENKSWPSLMEGQNGPSEPEEFELSFADIDEINEIQTDLWSNSDSTMSNNDSIDSDFEDISKAIVPVVISVSPDKMPPPILMKPEKTRKAKRNVVLDPFILLLDAALEGEMETVKDILRKVPDPSRPNPEGITALHNAVCGNHKDVVRYLVEVACDINSADNNGWTPLHCAAFYNDTELCQYLVEHGASVFATTYTDYQTPAHKCSRLDENYDVCFAYLHECKENVGRFNNGLVHALYDYTGENEDELSFTCGEELTVLRRGDTVEKEWWWARNRNGETGYIPCNLIGNYPRIAEAV